MPRLANSAVHVRSKETKAAFVAKYVPKPGTPICHADDLERMIEPCRQATRAPSARQSRRVRVSARLDAAILRMLWGWAHARHPRKGARWIKQKYFDRVGTRDWWFFGDTVDAQGSPPRVRLFHAASVRIVWHVKVRSGLNPYDRVGTHVCPDATPSLRIVRVHDLSVPGNLSRVSWKLSRTVLRGGDQQQRWFPYSARVRQQ
jgi:hypothetical protein